jgi:hypothetical protein
MYLRINPEGNRNAVHGVDYTKGLEDGRQCGKVHPYNTVKCRPVLYKEEDIVSGQETEYLDYETLSDREKLELGEPLFFGSSLHRALASIKLRRLTEIAELDVHGQTIAYETRVREEYEDR